MSEVVKRAVSGVTEATAEYVQTVCRKCTELSALFKRAVSEGFERTVLGVTETLRQRR